jgi:hypothetical protein
MLLFPSLGRRDEQVKPGPPSSETVGFTPHPLPADGTTPYGWNACLQRRYIYNGTKFRYITHYLYLASRMTRPPFRPSMSQIARKFVRSIFKYTIDMKH